MHVSEKGTPTRYPGVMRLSDGRFRLRGRVRHQKTDKPIDLDRIVGPNDKEPVHDEHQANKRRTSLLAALEGPREAPQQRQRLSDYVDLWLVSKGPQLKASTGVLYAGVLASVVDEVIDLEAGVKFGDYLVDTITAQDLVTWRDAQVRKPNRRTGQPTSARTVNGRIRVVKELLSDAVHDLGLPVDPTRRLEALREPRVPRKSLTAEELRKVLDAAREHTPQWYAFFCLLAYTGLRFGEATALRWCHLDEERGELAIRDSQWQGKVDTTKTDAERTVPVTPELLALLRAHREDQAAQVAKRLRRRKVVGIAEAQAYYEWLFPSRQPGKLLHNTAPRKALLLCLAKAGIERRFSLHGFRHTFNNLVRQVAEGTVVRSLTGHSSEEMTANYSAAEQEEKRRAVAGVLRLVSG